MSSVSFGMGKKQENQSILSESKIKKKSYRKVFREIKKTLREELKECTINVIKIKILKHKNEFSAEEWSVDICTERKDYVIDTFHPKGYFLAVFEKLKIFEKEKKMWKTIKKLGSQEKWRDGLLYFDELEAMEGKKSKGAREQN